jgi:Icc-related predicted phosphoesterase
MRVLFSSDLHGLRNAYENFASLLESCALGILAGDLADFSEDPGERERSLKEILLSAGRPVFFIMGNDDVSEWADHGPLRSINQKRVSFGQFNFVGYQFTTPFVGGLFEKDEAAQAADLLLLARLVDRKTVLVTHGPAHSILDKVRGAPYWDGRKYDLNETNKEVSFGGQELKKMLDTHPVWLHLFGHIHQSFGVLGNSVNGAFPHSRKFVEIELETRAVRFIDMKHGDLP